MSNDRLPPGTTVSDIDKHFGGEPDEYSVTVEYTVKAWDVDGAVENVLDDNERAIVDCEVVHTDKLSGGRDWNPR